MAFTLSPAQQRIVDVATSSLEEGNSGLIVSPTGSGKTVQMTRIRSHFEDKKFLFVQGTETLISQNMKTVMSEMEGRAAPATASRFDANEKNLSGHTIFATNLALFIGLESGLRLPKVDFIVIDECHHAAASSYQSIIKAAKAANPEVQTVGFTATDYRGDGANVREAVGGTPLARMTRKEAIEDGLILPSKIHAVDLGMDRDLAKLESTHADKESAAEGLLNTPEINRRMVASWKDNAENRTTIAFTTSPAHAHALAEAFSEADVRALAIDANTPEQERRRAYDDLAAGKLDVITNCRIATEGVDIPSVSCVMLARGRANPQLYMQMVGRGARVDRDDASKTDNLVLDFGCSSHDFMRLAGEHNGLEALDEIVDEASFHRRAANFKQRSLSPEEIERREVSRAMKLGNLEDFDGGHSRLTKLSDKAIGLTDGKQLAIVIKGERSYHLVSGKIGWTSEYTDHPIATIKEISLSSYGNQQSAVKAFQRRLKEMEPGTALPFPDDQLPDAVKALARTRKVVAPEKQVPAGHAASWLATLSILPKIEKEAMKRSADLIENNAIGFTRVEGARSLRQIDHLLRENDVPKAISLMRENRIAFVPEHSKEAVATALCELPADERQLLEKRTALMRNQLRAGGEPELQRALSSGYQLLSALSKAQELPRAAAGVRQSQVR